MRASIPLLIASLACGDPYDWGADSGAQDPAAGQDTGAGSGEGDPEVCGNGRDDDRDGLTDCEDGDCAEAAVCIEDCTDGQDNDQNGLTDCEDDACWATECAPRVRVSYGQLDLQHMAQTIESPGNGAVQGMDQWSAQATGIHGKLTGRVPGDPGLHTCEWVLDSASFQHTASTDQWKNGAGGMSSATTESWTPVQRSGLRLDADCPLQLSADQLPPLLRIDPSGPWTKVAREGTGGELLGGETIWYGGFLYSSATVQSTSTWLNANGQPEREQVTIRRDLHLSLHPYGEVGLAGD